MLSKSFPCWLQRGAEPSPDEANKQSSGAGLEVLDVLVHRLLDNQESGTRSHQVSTLEAKQRDTIKPGARVILACTEASISEGTPQRTPRLAASCEVRKLSDLRETHWLMHGRMG